ncbi:hypothetical protein EBR66_06420 [bacterium]|nr:hypothetical protein [bacterium]
MENDLQVFEISNPSASQVLLDDITKSSENLLSGVIQRYLMASLDGAYMAETIIKFKQAVFNANAFVKSFKFKKFTPPNIPPKPAGRS